MTPEKEFTPALGHASLTPLYDFAIALLTRENTWRTAMLKQISPSDGDRILDVGCGTGSLAIGIKQTNSACEMHGIDPDSNVLDRASKKAEKAGVDISFHRGFLTPDFSLEVGTFSKIVSSLVFHQTPMEEKNQILTSIRSLLQSNGKLYIADYGLQRNLLMRTLFRSTVQVIDGTTDTQHNALGCMPILMKNAGFSDISEALVVATATGSISIYSAALND